VVTAVSSDIDRAVRAQSVPPGTTRLELLQTAPGPTLERSVDVAKDICPAGTVRALEYHVPTGVIARLFPLEHRSFSSATTICLDALDKVVETEVFVDQYISILGASVPRCVVGLIEDCGLRTEDTTDR
jgi:hypothetical protein